MGKTQMRIAIPPIVLLSLTALAVSAQSCGENNGGPTDSGDHTWRISGITYVSGSTRPLSGVLLKCAGITSASGSDGRYEINGVPQGTQALTAEKAGYDLYSSSVEVSDDVTHYIYMGFKTTNLSGYVTNTVDGPIKEAKVTLGNMSDYTDVSGRYQFIGSPRGTDALSVMHPNYLGFKGQASLTNEVESFDVSLKRDSVIQGGVQANFYVDQANPSSYFPKYPSLQFLSLRADGYDNTGVYHSGIEQSILARLDFPAFLADERVTLLEASVEMCTDKPYAPFPVRTYAITSTWGTRLVTYNTRPSTGALLYTGSIGDYYSAKYGTVLGTDGVKALIADYRATGLMNGIMIKGGTIDSATVYSSYGNVNKPRIIFTVRF